MGRYLTMVILTICFFIPSILSAAEAEEQRDIPRLFGTFSPKSGVWSEYAIFDKSTGKRSVMRMSIVGIEADAYWYEVENREGEGSNLVKMLVKGDPNDPEKHPRILDSEKNDNTDLATAETTVKPKKKEKKGCCKGRRT